MSKLVTICATAAVLCISAADAAQRGPVLWVPPDFAPNANVGWIRIGGAEFKPPLSGAGPVMSDPAHPTITNDDLRLTGRQPTFPVADLSNPVLQDWTREKLEKRNEEILSGKPGFGPQQSCWPRGIPGFMLYGVQPIYILQTPREVVMIWQGDHQVRRIHIDVPHSANPKPSWYGESTGRYDGDTLVVDTIGLNDKTYIDGFLTPHTARLHVIERWHLVDGGKTLQVDIHVDDPGAFTLPWNAIQRYRRAEPQKSENVLVAANDSTSSAAVAGPMLEASCAENNVSYFGGAPLPIPTADKPDF
ncbi:MAG TPA: hypothetical protein VEU06_10985 [Micropepsaceae bacterium]|nr:hypothetical protein [Micropepsaceae bacterium]